MEYFMLADGRARRLQALAGVRLGCCALLALPALGCTQRQTDTELGAQLQADAGPKLDPFSFFVTSLDAMQRLSGDPNGFGGDLRFGETGQGAGLRGADKICSTIAEQSMPGAATKGWRAFLSAVAGGPNGTRVNAVDRIGDGPWYDRLGRIVSMNKTELIQQRPAAHPDIKDDLPNELGVPNHNPDGAGEVDNHDILTGSNDKGELFAEEMRSTCDDWTKSARDSDDAPRVGHSWPRRFGEFPGGPGVSDGGMGGPRRPGFPGRGGRDGGFGPPPGWDGGFPDFGDLGFGDPANWMSALNEAGCGPGVMLIEMGPPIESVPTVGSGGGYGGIYCFALTP